MAVPWSPDEINFIAEEGQRVKISPHFSAEKLHFMFGHVGPFQANIPTRVPLWLALFLKSSQSCTIFPPKWLTAESIRRLCDHERRDPDTLAEVPGAYLEISTALLSRAPESVRDCDLIKTLIEDLWAIRIEKIRRSILHATSESLDYFRIPHATRMEVHFFREPITRIRAMLTSLNTIARGRAGDDGDGADDFMEG
jgi:GINS complex subunit 2